LGINEPLICLKIARGEKVDAVENYPVGVMLLEPIEDLVTMTFGILDLFIYRLRIGLLGKAPIDSLNPPMAVREMLKSCRETYFNGKKRVFNPHFKYFFEDPLVSILWWLAFLKYVVRASRLIGR
jgi:hypothetical protein